ncbi:MAG: hypothetical protein JSR77_05990 [Planctomycetes bacterium]|nr:hypothetical protein [Planctomycetota bacterium]
MRRFFVSSLAVCSALFSTEHVAAQRSTPQQLSAPNAAAGQHFGSAVAIDGDTMLVGAPGNNQGSAHVYRWTGTGWEFEATLTPTGAIGIGFFGSSIAVEGGTAIIGDPGDNSGHGAAYVFTRTGDSWTQQAKLVASDGVDFAFLGGSVAISGDSVLIGADWDTVGINWQQGSAYVFTRSGSIWTQQGKLTVADGAMYDRFGSSVSLSGDVALVGACWNDAGANIRQGAAYIFTRVGSTWTRQAKLTAADGEEDDSFGCSVCLSGSTAIIGAAEDDSGGNLNQGSAYVFARSGSTWIQQAKLTASDGAADDFFGWSVGIAGATVVVGSYSADMGDRINQGSGYVFTQLGTTWTQQAKLAAPDGAGDDHFGSSIAISGDTLLIGANLDDVGPSLDQGSVWVFSRAGDVWIGPDFKIIGSQVVANDYFGWSVSISGDTALIGVREDRQLGYAYVFIRSGATWVQQARLAAFDGGPYDQFGCSVSLSGDTALVGAFNDDVGLNGQEGSAYVFVRSGTTWMPQAKLVASDGEWLDKFGYSVSVSGDTALIGAYGEDSIPGGDIGIERGAVYVFVRSGLRWEQEAKLSLPNGVSTRAFGQSVALCGDTALVGAPAEGVGADYGRGAAYVFARDGAAWTQQARLISSDGTAYCGFGSCVAISIDTALMGSPGWSDGRGAAYIFSRTGTTWTQQARLTASDGSSLDHFGASVGICGADALVGSPHDDIDGGFDLGSAYVFSRAGAGWIELAKLTAPDGAAGDLFGASVALAENTALAGAPSDDIAGDVEHGSAYAFTVAATDFPIAWNESTGVTFHSIATAVLAAQPGQTITGTEAAWRTVHNLDTAGLGLSLTSPGDIRTPPGSCLRLGNASSIGTSAGSSIDIFGELDSSQDATVELACSSFLLGSRGVLTGRASSTSVITVPTAELQGSVALEHGASILFSGDTVSTGSLLVALEANVASLGTFTNIGTLIANNSTINTPRFRNCATTHIVGGGTVLGLYANESGATTILSSGTLSIFGPLTSDGTIINSGDVSNLEVNGDLTLGLTGQLLMPFTGSLVRVEGSFDCVIDSTARYDMRQTTLQMEGLSAEQTLEVMSIDLGPDEAGLDRSQPGHYPIGTLHIGPALSTIRLIDTHDNDGLGQSLCEALYLDHLIIEAGSRLINPTCRIYYRTLEKSGTVDAPENLIQIGAPCFADFNQDGGIDGTDVQAFFVAWEAGDFAADVNLDGGVDGGDVQTFFIAWEAGGCM